MGKYFQDFGMQFISFSLRATGIGPSSPLLKRAEKAPRLVAQQQRQGFLTSVTWVRASACTSITPAVSYLPTGLAGCSVGPGISCGARKLARTPRVTKKKRAEK